MILYGKKAVLLMAVTTLLSSVTTSHAAIALDRTRAIFQGGDKNLVLNISNESKEKPYLAQSWVEDVNGNKVDNYFSITPALQRVEPSSKSVVRLSKLPAASSLPQDIESIFYFSVREIPPKSERPNTMQLALQTKIKLFYRPASILPERYSRQDEKLILHKVTAGYEVENPTPYFITVLGIKSSEHGVIDKNIKPVMISPKSKQLVRSGVTGSPYVTTINDFGGKPSLRFDCNGSTCVAALDQDKT